MRFAQSLAHLFYPRHSNNHKAKLTHSWAIFFFAFLLVAFSGATSFFKQSINGEVLGFAAQISVDDVIKFTNQKRAEAGLAPLTHNKVLSEAALAKGVDMINKDYWAHVSPEGTQPWKFFADFSYKYRYAGENLARDFSSADSAVNAWMASPTHRDNLLSPKYKEIGIGVVEGDLGGNDATIIVQFFGTTLSDSAPSIPVAAAKETAPEVVKIEPTPLPVPESKLASVASFSVSPISPFNAFKTVTGILLSILLIAFIIDAIVVARQNISRVSSRPIAHVAFLGMILAIVMIIQSGQIL